MLCVCVCVCAERIEIYIHIYVYININNTSNLLDYSPPSCVFFSSFWSSINVNHFSLYSTHTPGRLFTQHLYLFKRGPRVSWISSYLVSDIKNTHVMPRDQSTLTRVFRLFSSSFFFFFFLVIFFCVCVCVGSIIYTAATSFQLASFLSSSTHVDIQDTQTHVITCVEKSSIVSPVSFIGFQIRLMSTSNEKKKTFVFRGKSFLSPQQRWD